MPGTGVPNGAFSLWRALNEKMKRFTSVEIASVTIGGAARAVWPALNAVYARYVHIKIDTKKKKEKRSDEMCEILWPILDADRSYAGGRSVGGQGSL